MSETFEDETDVIVKLTNRVTELKQENKNLEKEIKYLKEKCIDVGKELGKHSFTWDGKEKNLVIQAMELNEMYEKAEQKLEKIKEYIQKSTKRSDEAMYELIKTDDKFLTERGIALKNILQIIESEE